MITFHLLNEINLIIKKKLCKRNRRNAWLKLTVLAIGEII